MNSATDFWLTHELLDPLADVNMHSLELIRERVRRAHEKLPGQPLPRVLSELAHDWSSLSDSAIARVARVPYLLVESIFVELVGAAPQGVRDAAAELEFFDPERLPVLVRELMTLAWHVARTRRQAARALLGMESRHIEALARCSLRELERLVDTKAIDVRLRWADRPAVWKHALAVATEGSDEALVAVKLRGLQLLAAQTWRGVRG
jgi:hypothetical protein